MARFAPRHRVVTHQTGAQPPSTPRWWLLIYLVGGIAVYWSILDSWFVADDWDFLLLAHRATGPMVAFTPLVGRFLRPLEVLTYYVNYEAFGLRPFPYHLTVVAVHIVSTWLVTRLAFRLGADRTIAFSAGLIFLFFGGHSEAVTWLGGAADAWLAMFMLAGLLLLARGLEAERATGSLAAALLVLTAGYLAKEPAGIAPGLIVAFGASRLLAAGAPARRIITRTILLAGLSTAALGGYVLIRARLFGSAFGAYSALGINPDLTGAFRAFLIRAFLPPGRVVEYLWMHQYDLVLVIAGAVLVAVLAVRYATDRPALVFLSAALLISLAPSAPLSIALINTVSERYLYTPTAFSCILMAWTIVRALPSRSLAQAAIGGLVVAHGVTLAAANRTWSEAAAVCRTLSSQIVEAVNQTPPGAQVIVLSVPDTINGAYVMRGAFRNALLITGRNVDPSDVRARFLASTMNVSAKDVTFVERTGPRSFTVTLKQGRFAEAALPPSPEYTVERWSSRGFDVTLAPTGHRIEVFFSSEGRLYHAGRVEAGS